MSQRIVIDPVTRIEGHAKITLHLDDEGEVTDARFHVVEFRGFEKFCEGRSFREMPGITARICGICPVSHLLASAKAGDELLARRDPARAPTRLRRLMHYGQIVQSHALTFFHLSSPDFLLGHDSDPAKRNVMGLIAAEPRGRAPRHPPAPVRPGGDRDPGRQEDPPDLGRAGRRRRAADRRRPRPDPGAGCRRRWRRSQKTLTVLEARDGPPPGRGAGLRQLPLALHGPGDARRRPGALRRQAPHRGRDRQHRRRPASTQQLPGLHRRGGRALDLPQVPLLQAARLPRRDVPRGPAGAAQRGLPLRHAARRPRAARVPAAGARRRALRLPLPLRPPHRDPVLRRADRGDPGRPGSPDPARAAPSPAATATRASAAARPRAAPSSTTTR